MMLAIALRRDGWKVVYLGADTPFDAALALARRVSARLVGISMTTKEHADALTRDRELEGVELVVGGKAATPTLAKRLGARRVPAERLSDCVAALRDFAA